jgi:hypothetical protein
VGGERLGDDSVRVWVLGRRRRHVRWARWILSSIKRSALSNLYMYIIEGVSAFPPSSFFTYISILLSSSDTRSAERNTSPSTNNSGRNTSYNMIQTIHLISCIEFTSMLGSLGPTLCRNHQLILDLLRQVLTQPQRIIFDTVKSIVLDNKK